MTDIHSRLNAEKLAANLPEPTVVEPPKKVLPKEDVKKVFRRLSITNTTSSEVRITGEVPESPVHATIQRKKSIVLGEEDIDFFYNSEDNKNNNSTMNDWNNNLDESICKVVPLKEDMDSDTRSMTSEEDLDEWVAARSNRNCPCCSLPHRLVDRKKDTSTYKNIPLAKDNLSHH